MPLNTLESVRYVTLNQAWSAARTWMICVSRAPRRSAFRTAVCGTALTAGARIGSPGRTGTSRWGWLHCAPFAFLMQPAPVLP